MIALDEDALICDLAETYGIYEHRDLKPSKIAIFSSGLPQDSRIKMLISGAKIPISQLIAALSADKLANLVWMMSEDGQKKQNPPKLITPILLGKEKESTVVTYDSLEEFQIAMKKYERKVE